MKKFIALSLLLFVLLGLYYWLSFGFILQAAIPECETVVLSRALEATGAIPLDAEFHGWTKVSDRYMSPRELEQLVIKMARAFELGEHEIEVLLRATGYYAYAVMDYDLTDTIFIRVQAQALENQTIASIELRQKHHRDLSHNYKKIERALGLVSAEGEINITSCLAGTINGRLKNGEKLNIAASAFGAIEAEYLEGTDLQNLAVWTGWSPRLPEGIEYAQRHLNFSVAIGSDLNGIIVVRVATPVILGSYR